MNVFRWIFNFIKQHKIISTIIVILSSVAIFIFRPQPQPPVPTQTVKRSHFVQSVSVSGAVKATNSAALTFLISGNLVYLPVKKGDYVKKYQTIAVLDQRTAQKNLQATLIAYAKQRNNFDQTRDTNQNRTPQQALNDQMMRILQNNQYDLNAAINSVELQALANEQSILTSPISGIVTRTDVVTPGINIGPTTTFMVVDPNSVVFDMDVDEADIGAITGKQQVDIVLDPFPNTTLHLTVQNIDFVSHTTSTGGTAYTVEVNLPKNDNYQYKIGMNGNGQIITNKRDTVISIPISSIADNDYVYVETQANVFEKRKITLGLQNDTDTEIIHGLQPGEKVALDPTNAAKNVRK